METQVLIVVVVVVVVVVLVVVVVVSVGGKRVGDIFFKNHKQQLPTKNWASLVGVKFKGINGYDVDILEQS